MDGKKKVAYAGLARQIHIYGATLLESFHLPITYELWVGLALNNELCYATDAAVMYMAVRKAVTGGLPPPAWFAALANSPGHGRMQHQSARRKHALYKVAQTARRIY